VRTTSPRAAVQLAAAGMGVTIAPYSALTPLPAGIIRSLDPPELRDVIATIAAPHDAMLRQFALHLREGGLPGPHLPPVAHLSRHKSAHLRCG